MRVILVAIGLLALTVPVHAESTRHMLKTFCLEKSAKLHKVNFPRCMRSIGYRGELEIRTGGTIE